MQYIASLNETDWGELKVILMDKDGDAALEFLKEKIAKPIEHAQNKALDVSRGRP